MSFLRRVGSKSTVSKEYKCTIRLLDDNETLHCDFPKHETGRYILDYVCDYLSLVEKDYFGIRYMDNNKQRYWLDLTKPIKRQIKGISQSVQMVFSFRVKFYPQDASVMREEVTRYMLYLQLKRDLMHGRLYCPQNDAALLGAYSLQAELGDYNPDDHTTGYVSEYKILLRQTAKVEEKIAELHQSATLRGQTPAQAELQFLTHAAQLDTYGFDPHQVKDSKGTSVYIGATFRGILVYQANRKLHHINWDQVDKIDYLGKDFLVHQRGSTDKKDVLKFLCPSGTFAKHLWKYILEQKAFFTALHATDVKPQVARGALPFIRRTKFRYNGRVFSEIVKQPTLPREQPNIKRFSIERQPSRSERTPWAVGNNKYATLPKSYRPKNGESLPLKSHEAPSTLALETSFDSSQPSTTMSSPRSAGNDESEMFHPIPISTSYHSDFMPVAEEPATVGQSPTRGNDYHALVEDGDLKSRDTPPKVDGAVSRHHNVTAKKIYGAVEQNGATPADSSAAPICAQRPSLCRRLIRYLLASILITGIITVLVACVMEVKEPNVRRLVDGQPAIDAFRHTYYQPVRGQVLKWYASYVKR